MQMVEVVGTGSWRDYIEEVVHQSTEEERVTLYGVESNTETEQGDYIVEMRKELVGVTVIDYYQYCAAAELKPSILCFNH